ncbi:MAG: hypothetical protein EXR79_10390 [Myxococcales bacterium]|nr:hypothetical protein [Myxococcales bacterium]
MPTAPSADLRRQLDALHLRFHLHFVDHARLTRDVGRLDALIGEAEALHGAAFRLAELSDDLGFRRVVDAAERRLDTYRAMRGSIAQAHAAAGLRDREANQLTRRAGFVVHRYLRHFALAPPDSGSEERLVEIIADLRAIERRLAPMLPRLQVPQVAGEAATLAAFLQGFEARLSALRQTRVAEAGPARHALLVERLHALHGEWLTHVQPLGPALRRVGLLDRLVHALDTTVDALLLRLGVADADAAVAHGATWLLLWQRERAATVDAHLALAPRERAQRLFGHAHALHENWRRQLLAAPATRDRVRALWLCDAIDEVEIQLTALADGHAGAVDVDALEGVRDVLAAATRSHDQVVAARALAQ